MPSWPKCSSATYHRSVATDRPDDRLEYRLSDAEREEALDALSEHVRTGRLDLAEFDERSARISAAKFRRELEPLFADLPEPRPSVLRSSHPRSQSPRSVVGRSDSAFGTWRQKIAANAVPLAAVVAVLLFFTVARGMIFVFVLPALVALLAGSFSTRRRR